MTKLINALIVLTFAFSAFANPNLVAKQQRNSAIIAAKLKVIAAKEKSAKATNGKILALSYRYGAELGSFKAIGTSQELNAAKKDLAVTKQEIEATKAEIEALHAENQAIQAEISAEAAASAPIQ